MTRTPTLAAERRLWEAGHKVVAGVDEAGWGALAGPVSVGAAVVPKDMPIPDRLRDSKALKKATHREAVFDLVREWCEHWAVGHATHAECDEMGFLEARSLAADRALDGLGVEADHVLVDGNMDFVGGEDTTCLEKGDVTSVSIAAASVLAKVVRDRIMGDLSPHFPGYDLESNKGYYGHTGFHKDALLAQGPSGIHRRNTKFMKKLRRAIPPHEAWPDLPASPMDLADYARLSPSLWPDGVTWPRPDQ